MTAANLDATNLADAVRDGVLHEDVLNKIFDISFVPLPLTEMLQKQTSGNAYKSWTTFDLGDPVTTNKTVDGADITGDDSEVGLRQGNYHQTSTKIVQVSKRANASDSIGTQGSLVWQVAQQQKKLRRDVEAQMLSQQPSVKGDGLTVAGQSAGLGAWLETNVFRGVGGVNGGFDGATGLVDAPTIGTKEALSETNLRDMLQSVYEEGGLSKYGMVRPAVMRNISTYLFSAGAGVAQPQSDNNQTNPSGMTMQGSTNIFISDFDSVLRFTSNRLQPETAAAASTMFLLDPEFLGQSFLTGYQVEPLAKTGLSEKRLMSVDYTLCVLNEKAQGAIYDIDEAIPMIA